jgi:phosphoenolpyruvate synthase/pyruvate phosphate dikinase
VLVCPVTSPVWSLLFPSVAALVSDTGEALSHPAIIAREFGIPAVVATRNATAVLRDGRRSWSTAPRASSGSNRDRAGPQRHRASRRPAASSP